MPKISPTDLQQALAADAAAQVVDVRTPAEYAQVHVPQARNFPLSQLEPGALFASGQLDRAKPVYLLCQGGTRAELAAAQFSKEGFADTHVIAGGTAAWEKAGLPVERGESKVISLERQVRIGAGSLVLLGVLLSYFVHPYFLGLSAFVGAGLVFAGLTDWCGMGLLLAKAPWNTAPGR